MPKGRAPKKVDKEKRKRVQKKAQESRQRLVNQFREDTRDKFFKGNENISDDRLDRRRQQDLSEQRFIRTRMKPVGNTKGTLLQKRDPEGIDLAEFRRRNAMQYGPTLSEIGSDIGYGLSSIAKGFAEKGTPMIQLFKGLSDKFKGGVESAWDAVRGEPTTVEGTNFPQPGSDTKDLFSSIDTGIAQVDPNNLLVQIAKANEGRFDDTPTFQDQLASATVENLNVPKIGDVVQTIGDYYNAYQEGVNVNTPIGTVNLNPAREGIFLQNKLNNLPISYSGSYTPGLNQATAGIQMALPNDYKLTGGTNFNEGDLSLSKSYNSYLRGVNDITPYVSTNLDESRAGVSVGFDPLAALGIPSSLAVPINVGVSTDQSGNITPNFNLRVPFQYGNEGLGFMFK
jgi:hypothetical protein